MKRVCAHCGTQLDRNAGVRAKYCSDACRQAAYRARKAQNPTAPGTTADNFGVRRGPGGHVTVDLTRDVSATITREEFERMMDDTVEDTLRFTRGVLKMALPEAPANTLAPISKQLIEIAKELEARTGGAVFDDASGLGESEEVSEEAFDLGQI
nr:MAG TPA: protein of unknown function (DUF3330) [Caudoviricetes sp.]